MAVRPCAPNINAINKLAALIFHRCAHSMTYSFDRKIAEKNFLPSRLNQLIFVGKMWDNIMSK